ncbi:MAG: tRNA-dihydrouridine synthase family protein [Bacteriovoracaceae bacterium]
MNARDLLTPVKKGSIFFAPLEGITDESFRKLILRLYPEWDYLACDFLRAPGAGRYPTKHLIKHFGKELFQYPEVQSKTMYQILTAYTAFTDELVQDLNRLEIPWLDLNLGCPAARVCGHGGGSSLLKDLTPLRPLIRGIRKNFNGRFSAKIRVGYSDDKNFEECIHMLNEEGVELITVHGRTRDQLYKEPANWKYIKRAVEISEVPIVGNGDIWETNDINRMFEETGCHAVMVARGALKSPWMAQDYKNQHYFEKETERPEKIKYFFNEYKKMLEETGVTPKGLMKQSKSMARFMLDTPATAHQRRALLLSQNAEDFFNIIKTF